MKMQVWTMHREEMRYESAGLYPSIQEALFATQQLQHAGYQTWMSWFPLDRHPLVMYRRTTGEEYDDGTGNTRVT